MSDNPKIIISKAALEEIDTDVTGKTSGKLGQLIQFPYISKLSPDEQSRINDLYIEVELKPTGTNLKDLLE